MDHSFVGSTDTTQSAYSRWNTSIPVSNGPESSTRGPPGPSGSAVQLLEAENLLKTHQGRNQLWLKLTGWRAATFSRLWVTHSLLRPFPEEIHAQNHRLPQPKSIHPPEVLSWTSKLRKLKRRVHPKLCNSRCVWVLTK